MVETSAPVTPPILGPQTSGTHSVDRMHRSDKGPGGGRQTRGFPGVTFFRARNPLQRVCSPMSGAQLIDVTSVEKGSPIREDGGSTEAQKPLCFVAMPFGVKPDGAG